MPSRLTELQASGLLEQIFQHHVRYAAKYAWNNKKILEVLPFDSACHNLVAEFLEKLQEEKQVPNDELR